MTRSYRIRSSTPPPMKLHPVVLSVTVVALFSMASPALAQNTEVEELKSMVRAMQKTIAEQNARIAALEKQQATQKQKPASKPAATSDRSVTVVGMDVPVAELPTAAVPKGRSSVRDTDSFADQQQAAPRPNNVPLDPELKGFIAIPGTDTIFKIGGSARVDTIL